MLQARCGSRASEGSASAGAGDVGAGEADQRLPAANPGLLSEHERSVLLALMLLRHTVRRFQHGCLDASHTQGLGHLLVLFLC